MYIRLYINYLITVRLYNYIRSSSTLNSRSSSGSSSRSGRSCSSN